MAKIAQNRETNTKSDIPISEIKGVGRPATGAFEYYIKVTKLKQLTKYTEKELLKLHGVGPKAISVIKLAFKERGWSFKKD